MAAAATARLTRPALTSVTPEAVPFSLTPLFPCARLPVARFSTSHTLWKGGRGDNNRIRGLSAVRHTGPRPRQTLSVKQKDYANQRLPTPVERTTSVQGDPDHGLWEFFKDKKLLRKPEEESRHGSSMATAYRSRG